MGDSELEELVKKETDLFKIIGFCERAVLDLGEEYWRKDYGMNSDRGIEFKQALYDYHGFNMSLHGGASGAYGEWNELVLAYRYPDKRYRIVLDVEYSGPHIDRKYDFKVISSSKDEEWRKAILALAGQKGLLVRERKALEEKKKLEAAEEQRKMEIAWKEEEKRETEEQRKKLIREHLNGF